MKISGAMLERLSCRFSRYISKDDPETHLGHGLPTFAITLAAGALYAWGILPTPAVGGSVDHGEHSDCGNQCAISALKVMTKLFRTEHKYFRTTNNTKNLKRTTVLPEKEI